MPLVRNFLTEAVSKVRQKADHFSDPVLPEGRETDSRYREQAEHNLRQSEKHFMWGKASEILTMVMSAVLMGGVTGTLVKAAAAGSFGLPLLGAVGVALATASLAAAYVSFKSQGRNWMNVNETNADLNARSTTRELAPAISQSVGQEVKSAFKDAIKELHQEQQQAMIAGAANTNGTVPAAVGGITPEPTVLIQKNAPEMRESPSTRTHAQPETRYEGKPLEDQKMLEAAAVRQ